MLCLEQPRFPPKRVDLDARQQWTQDALVSGSAILYPLKEESTLVVSLAPCYQGGDVGNRQANASSPYHHKPALQH